MQAPVEQPPSGPKRIPEERQDWQQSASVLQLFAYPEDRRLPWASLSVFLASSAATLTFAAMWQQVARATSLEELQIHLERFTQRLAACSATWPLQMNELHRLLLASLLHAGEQPARVFADAAVLLFGGTLLERLYGARFLLLLLGSSTMLSNAMALTIHQYFVSSPEGLSSTSGALVALGSFLALRHPRWAIWPGIPIPVSWLMAPVLVADLSLARAYFRDLSLYRSSEKATKQKDEASGLQPSVALAACMAVEDCARRECRPPPADVVSWRMELEAAANEDVLVPEATLWADISGLILGLCAVGLSAVWPA